MELHEKRRDRAKLEPLIQRLGLSCIDDAREIATIRSIWRTAEKHRLGSSIPYSSSVRMITSGWAGWVRALDDRRRAIFLFLVPGDFLIPGILDPAYQSDVVALTCLKSVDVAALLTRDQQGDLIAPKCQKLIAEIGTSYKLLLLNQLTRLSCGDGLHNVADLVLEFYRRLMAAGQCLDGRLSLPIGQRTMGQSLGISAVQVNRLLHQMREAGLIAIGRDWLEILSLDALEIITSGRTGPMPIRASE